MRDHTELLEGLEEKQFRGIILIPLFKKMGMRYVIEYHGGSAKKGKDIIAYYDGPLGDRHYVAIVAKVGDIHGSVSKKGSAAEVLFQAEQALNEPYTDIYDLKEIRIDECWVATTGKIKNTAVESIRGKLAKSHLDKLVRFIDRQRLVELIATYLPGFWHGDKLILQLAHELRGALVGIRNSADILRRRWDSIENEQRNHKLNAIEMDVQIAFRLIDSFTLEQLTELSLTRARFNCFQEVILQAIEALADSDRTRISLLPSRPFSEAFISGDARLIRHAFFCILDNALKYSSGNVLVQMDCGSNDGNIVLTISDDGIGVPEGLEEIIFEPGYRAPNANTLSVAGIGIGLTVARRIVREHGGQIEIQRNSKPTEFALYLPWLKS